MKKIKIFIVDDHNLFRSGLKFILSQFNNLEVIGEASNGKEFLVFLENLSDLPDIILLDINMPIMNGIEATKIALKKFPNLKIIVLSMYGETEYYNTMIDLGVKGFILKDCENKDLIDAIERVNNGGTYFSQEILLSLIQERKSNEKIKLTKREKEILELICKGYSNNEIAEKLFISQRTVERHRANLLEKTNSKNSISLVVFALKNKLVDL